MSKADSTSASPAEPPARSVRRREPDAVRGRIVSAAKDLFAARGFDGATMEEIARQAQSSTQLIVYHFKSKLGLWRAVVESLSLPIDDALTDILSHTEQSCATRIIKAITLKLESLARSPELHRIIVIDAYADSERLKWLVETYDRQFYESFVALLREAQALGIVRDVDPARLRYVILGVAALPTMSAEYRALTGRDAADPAEIEASLDFIKKLIFVDPAALPG